MTNDYARVLKAEPRLRPIAELVDALCTLIRPKDAMCAGCVWERIVKPLVTPLVGWSRGRRREQASDEPRLPYKVFSGAELLARDEQYKPEPAASETEKWLRSSDAFDAFTDEILRRLDDADPANGHGIYRGDVDD